MPEYRLVERLAVDGRIHQSWQEAVEREVGLPVCNLEALGRGPVSQAIAFPREKRFESLRDASGLIVGVTIREHEALSGVVTITGEAVEDQVFKIRVHISKHHALCDHERNPSRRSAVEFAGFGPHRPRGRGWQLGVAVRACRRDWSSEWRAARTSAPGRFCVGVEGESDTMLSSPIILYDYPQIAPESAGDLFDGTEIDEILSLRIMTLTEEEKREMSQSDERARAMLERTESMPVEQLMKLHGVLRGLRSLEEDTP